MNNIDTSPGPSNSAAEPLTSSEKDPVGVIKLLRGIVSLDTQSSEGASIESSNYSLVGVTVKNNVYIHNLRLFGTKKDKKMRIFLANDLFSSEIPKIYTLIVDPESSVHSLKLAIEAQGNVKVEKQILIFAHQQLEDRKTLIEYGIENDCTIHLFQYDTKRIKIFIQDSSTRTTNVATIEAEPKDTIKDVVAKIENIFRSDYRIHKIQPTSGGNPYKGCLLRGRIEDPRNPGTTLNVQFRLFNEDRLIAVDDPTSEPGKYPISIIYISLSDSIEDIYLKVQNTVGTGLLTDASIDEEELRRKFSANLSLSEIYKRSPFDQTLLARKGILIFFSPGMAKSWPLEVDRDENVGKLKTLIREKGISADDPMILHLYHRELEDSRSLLYYHIREEWTLYITKRPRFRGSMQIVIDYFDGEKAPMEVEPYTTIRALQEEIENDKGIPVHSQIIIFNKTIIRENWRTFQEYDIPKNSVLKCVYEPYGTKLEPE